MPKPPIDRYQGEKPPPCALDWRQHPETRALCADVLVGGWPMRAVALRVVDADPHSTQDAVWIDDRVDLDTLYQLDLNDRFQTCTIPGRSGRWIVYILPRKE